MVSKPRTASKTLPFDPRFQPIHTDYTNDHLGGAGFCAADVVFQSGAVVANAKGDVLLLEDIETGRMELPRSGVQTSLESLFSAPLQFVEDKTGLVVERLPLPKQTRRYRNPGVNKWDLLEQELQFDISTTTAPFATGLDVVYIERPECPDSRQAITSWYSGLVRDEPENGAERNGVRLHFMPIEEAIQTVQDPYCDHLAAMALTLFKVLWDARQASLAE